MIPGRPGPRRCMKFHFCATNRRCHRISVSGETIVSSSNSALRPTALAFLASSARSASVNRMRFPRSRFLRRRFSAWRNSITISWWRFTQLAATISKNENSGGTGPMPEVYRAHRSNCWTARLRHRQYPLPQRQARERARRDHPRAGNANDQFTLRQRTARDPRWRSIRRRSS